LELNGSFADVVVLNLQDLAYTSEDSNEQIVVQRNTRLRKAQEALSTSSEQYQTAG
jgi:hypothetical protein